MTIWIGLEILGIVLGVVFVFVRFTTTVSEGTAKAIMSFGQFSKIVFRWRDHFMDEAWNIWRKDEKGEGKKESKVWDQKIIGGLIVYFWPFQKIHQYKHRWTDIRLRDSRMEVEYHEEEMDYVLLKPAVYAFKLTAVETSPPERIPVDVLVLVTLKVRNPYLFLFVAPPTPIEDILARISAEVRALVTSQTLDDLLKLKGESLWELLKGAKVIEETLSKWGVALAEKGIEIRDIDLTPEYQKAAAAKRQEELRAGGRAEEIMGTVILAIARATGRPEKEVQQEFQADPAGFYQKHQRTIENIMTKLSMEAGQYLRIETPGATGISADLLRLISAWKRMPMGPSSREKPGEEKKPEEKPATETKSPKRLTRRDLEEELKKLPRDKKEKRIREISAAILRGEVEIDWKAK